MSYRSLVPLFLGTATALFAAWLLLSPPLYCQQPQEEVPQEEEEEDEEAPEEPVKTEPVTAAVPAPPAPAAPAETARETPTRPAQAAGANVEVDTAIPAEISPTRLEIDHESGDLVRLPFDHPFTVVLSLGALDLGDRETSLRFMEFRRQFDVFPDNVCTSGRQATFAGVTTAADAGGTTQKARFIMPALDPNRYVAFCFQTTAQISAELSIPESQALASAFKRALAGLETELETADFVRKQGEFRAALEAALSSFAQREGLGGTVRLEEDFRLGDLLRDFHVPRQAMLHCDRKELLDLSASFVGRARTLWLESMQSLEGRSPARLDLASCRNLYAAGLTVAMELGNKTFAGNLRDPLENLDRLDPALEAFAARAIRAVQARNSLFLATSIPAASVAQRYVSADAGFAFIPHLDQSVTFTGINIYLRPVNPPSVTPLGWGWKGLARRTSLTIGVTLNEDLVRKDTVAGVETKIVDDLTAMGSPLLGIGFRVNPALRLEAGAVVFKQLDTLVSQTLNTEVNYYFALSLDMDVASLFTGGRNSLFNGGTPAE